LLDGAEKPGRDWIGIDPAIAGQLAISLIKNRLQDTCGSRMKFITGAHTARVPDPAVRRVESSNQLSGEVSGAPPITFAKRNGTNRSNCAS